MVAVFFSSMVGWEGPCSHKCFKFWPWNAPSHNVNTVVGFGLNVVAPMCT